MLMAIQFPGDLGIANCIGIEVVDLVPWAAWRNPLVNGIQMPVDGWSVLHVCKPQQTKPVSANLFRFRNNRLDLPGEALPESGNNVGNVGGIEKECARQAARGKTLRTLSVGCRRSVECDIHALGDFLSKAIANFRSTHCGNAGNHVGELPRVHQGSGECFLGTAFHENFYYSLGSFSFPYG